MRVRFRRRSEASPADDERPAAVFAGILDGRRLWVAIESASPAPSDRIGLRDPETGRLLDVPDDDPGDQPGYLSARLDLAALPEPPPAVLEVVVESSGGLTPVATPPLPRHRPAPTPDGRTRFLLARGDDHSLRVRSERVVPAATLTSVRSEPDPSGGEQVALCLSGPGARLRLVTDDDTELASWPLTGDVVALGEDDLVALASTAPQVARLLLDDLPVRRADNDLDDPARAVPLPALGRLRLRWSGLGLLQARLLEDPETAR